MYMTKSNMPLQMLVNVHMRQLCQYISLYRPNAVNNVIRINGPYTFHITWHMALNKYTFHITLLDTQVQKKNCNFYLSCYCHICATNMPVKCHIYATCANYFMCIHHTTVSVYMLHMNSMQSTVWLQALISIHSHYWHMPLKIYASYIVNVKGFMIWCTISTMSYK